MTKHLVARQELDRHYQNFPPRDWRQVPNAARRLLRSAEFRKIIDVPRVSFESMMRKRARAAWTTFSAEG